MNGDSKEENYYRNYFKIKLFIPLESKQTRYSYTYL